MIPRTLLLVLLLAGPLPAPAAPWIDPASACLRGLGAAADELAFAAACPAASAVLRDDPWSTLAVEPDTGWSVSSIRRLVGTVEHYERPTVGPAPDADSLDAVLARLPRAAERPGLSAWQRLREWLLGVLDDDQIDVPDWLEALSLPEQVARVIWYAAGAVVVLLAAAIVGNELRYRSGRRRVPATAPGVAARAPGTAAPSLAVLAGRPPRQQLELLLRLVLLRLQAQARLPGRPGLTHREIATTADLGDVQRGAVQGLSAAAERAVYGGWVPAPEDVAPHLASVRRLLDELGGSAS